MKLSLFVTQGNAQGKSIPITVQQFVIGRDPQCHLRPASPVISKRHCALVIREGKAYLLDFGSTNGSFVNDQPVKGEQELKHKDQLKIGPLAFEVRMETPTPVDKPTPLPTQPKAARAEAAGDEDDAIAGMLLDAQDDESVGLGAVVEPDQGSTILDLNAAKMAEEVLKHGQAPKPSSNPAAAKKSSSPASAKSSTQSAAEAILAKMSRRNRK